MDSSKWGKNYGFYQSKVKPFQSLVSEISSDMINDAGKLLMKTRTSVGFQL